METVSIRRRKPQQKYAKFTDRFTNVIFLSRLAIAAFIGLIIIIISSIFLFIWFSHDLPTPGKLVNNNKLGEATRIYDKSGILLYSVHSDNVENRIYVQLPNIPKDLQHATVAVEDKNFYTEPGFSSISYLRVIRDLILYHQVTGGSGLTQQLVKNVLLSSERTLPRKVKELILAIQVDKTYTKDQILEMYLNDVGYGGANLGVEAGSEYYFGKHVQDLDLAQAAFLAGMPQGPTLYNPYTGSKLYINRTQAVLNQMIANNYITQKQADDAFNEIKNTTFTGHIVDIKAPWFVMYVKDLLAQQFGAQEAESGGLQVTTTLDYTIEKNAEDIVSKEIDGLKAYHVANGAAMVTEPKSGAILAMVGNKDYFNDKIDGQYNIATSRYPGRQPGSSLKPIIYSTAFNKGYTPASMIMDTPTNFTTGNSIDPDYTPVNYDGKFHGPVLIRTALANSLNIPAVKTLARVGIKDAMQLGYNMGIQSWNPTPDTLKQVGLSLVLGGRETTLYDETTAYGVFANQGVRQDLFGIQKVTDATGKVLYEHQQVQGPHVLSQEVSFLISHVLSDNNARSMEFGPNSSLNIPGHTVSVKTGTTDSKRDNWTVGYTSSYVVGVWVGNADNSPMNQAIASGITGASPIWHDIMSSLVKGKTDQPLSVPSNVVAAQVDCVGGGQPKDGVPTCADYFIKGTEPQGSASIYQKIKLSKHQQGKLANAAEIAAGDYDTKDYIVFREADPVSQDGKNRWQEGIDAWLHQTYAADHPEYYPPTNVSDFTGDGDPGNVQPNNNQSPSPTPTPPAGNF